MSRPVSLAARRALYAPETGEVFLILLTLSHPTLGTPLRLVNDSGAVTSCGETFVAYPFDLTLPEDDEGRPPRARLSIDNIDRQIVATVRNLTSSPSVLIEIVRAADPDTVEARFADFRFVNISYDSQVVEGDLTLEDFTAEPFPAGSFSPALFPGIF